jgi:hypothetical protein
VSFDLSTAKENVKRALLLTSKWREYAKQDYEFVDGKQWTDADLKKMRTAGRPAITINRIRPIINLLCGYSAQNETEPDFLPRSEEDDRVARVAKGITKYVFDQTNYQRVKKQAFRDAVTCGAGYYWLTYDYNWSKMDGKVTIDNVSPFDVFIDPECIRDDLSDANYCGRYSWQTPERLCQVYPDKAEAIRAMSHEYDETELETLNTQPLWYSRELKKIRVVQYWYREYSSKPVYAVGSEIIDESRPEEFAILSASGAGPTMVMNEKIRYATFCGGLLLEEGDSPYKHGHFPLVVQYCYKSGWGTDEDDGLEPAGVVRDLKDPQRELNKNRSQRMHIVNQQSLGVRFWHGNVSEPLKREIKKKATTPGANIFLPNSVTFEDGLPSSQSVGNIELENQAQSDFYSISGITPESLSGSVGQMSGKAIDLRQSVTTVQTAEIFDNAKEAELEIVKILWGEKGSPGLIPQYFNTDKVLRILGDDGKKEWIQIQPGIGQAMQEQPELNPMTGQPQTDEEGNPVTKVLYDLSCFDFDIVITTSQASATARAANLYQLLDAKKSGVDIPMDIILDFMDFPEKETVKKRIQEQAEAPKMPDVRVSGTLDQLPAEALSQALQSIGVSISPQQIMAERLALKGKAGNPLPNTQQIAMPPQGIPQGMPIDAQNPF